MSSRTKSSPLNDNQTQADSLLARDLNRAADCVSDIWEQNSSVLADAQNTALASLAQSTTCDVIEKFFKKNSAIADATAANTFFINLIAAVDATATSSAYLTARRAAEKALFGIV
jgi:uncharacterized protein YhbP (UPF0306 family)